MTKSAELAKSLQRWRQRCQDRDDPLSNEEKVELWQEVFRDHDLQRWGPPPIWAPAAGSNRNPHLAEWMAELGHLSVKEFHRWSVEHRAEFWGGAVKRLGIEWTTPPQQTLDLSDGPAAPHWFRGGRLNLVAQCLAGRLADRVVLKLGRPDGHVEEITGRELLERVRPIAAGLRELGFQVGDAIAIVMPMNRDAIAAYLAIIAAGCVAVSIPESFAAPEIATRLRIANAKGVFTIARFQRVGRDFDLYSRIVAARDELADRDSLRILVSRGAAANEWEPAENDLLWDDSLGKNSVAADPPDSFRDYPVGQLINILFSSGTTGDPKAIPWTQVTTFKCGVDGMLLHDLGETDVVAWPTSLGWMMGPWLLFASWLNGAAVAVFEDAPTAEKFIEFVQQAGVTMLGVIPTLVRHWRSAGLLDRADWSQIRRFSSTGEASQVDDMVYLSAAAGCKPIIEYCGGTEIGGGYIASTMVEPNSPAAFNTIAFGLDLQILDDEGRAALEGEVFLVPPSVGLSNELLNRDHFETYYAGTPRGIHGELLRRHGDRFHQFESGLYAACGRADDTMNLGGIKVSSAELERALNRVAGIQETAAVAYSPRGGGPERLVVFAVLLPTPVASDSPSPEPRPTVESLLARFNEVLKQQVNPLYRVSQVLVVESLPRTASNKVMRRKLREQLA